MQACSGYLQCSDSLFQRYPEHACSPLILSYLRVIPLSPLDFQLLLKDGDGNRMAKESSQNHTTISYRKITTGHFSSISPPASNASLPAFL